MDNRGGKATMPISGLGDFETRHTFFGQSVQPTVIVFPAQAGIPFQRITKKSGLHGIPACAGMTVLP